MKVTNIAFVHICKDDLIVFLDEFDMDYSITDVEGFMDELGKTTIFDHQETDLLNELGLEAFHTELDFTNKLREILESYPKIIDKFAELN